MLSSFNALMMETVTSSGGIILTYPLNGKIGGSGKNAPKWTLVQIATQHGRTSIGSIPIEHYHRCEPSVSKSTVLIDSSAD